MSIRINNIKYLNANNYKRIMIREEGGFYRIDITPFDDNFDTLPSSYKLTDDIKQYNDEDKIMMIIDSFLRSSRINELKQNTFLDYYSGKFNIVKGSRELDFRIFNSKVAEAIKNINKKYEQDRYNFCQLNKDVMNYEVTTSCNSTSYEKIEFKEGSYIKFTLVGEYGNLKKYEEEFLCEFINEKLYGVDEDAKIVCHNVYSPHNENYIYLGKYLECGDFRMRMNCNKKAEHIIYNIVDKYNEERNNAKKMQLKMEGF